MWLQHQRVCCFWRQTQPVMFLQLPKAGSGCCRLAHRGGLVQEEDGGSADQSTGNAEASLLSPRQAPDKNATGQCSSYLQVYAGTLS